MGIQDLWWVCLPNGSKIRFLFFYSIFYFIFDISIFYSFFFYKSIHLLNIIYYFLFFYSIFSLLCDFFLIIPFLKMFIRLFFPFDIQKKAFDNNFIHSVFYLLIRFCVNCPILFFSFDFIFSFDFLIIVRLLLLLF